MTPLAYVAFNKPVALHGRLIREIQRHQAYANSEGYNAEGWDLHLHAEWQCVIVDARSPKGPVRWLVPIHHVERMECDEVSVPDDAPGDAPSNGHVSGPSDGPARRGRPRTKRLGLVEG